MKKSTQNYYLYMYVIRPVVSVSLEIYFCWRSHADVIRHWWNHRGSAQYAVFQRRYTSGINICTNKSGPFIREQNMKLVVVHAIIHSFGSKKLAPCKIFSWLLSWLLTFKTGTWKWHLVIFLAPTFWEPEQPLLTGRRRIWYIGRVTPMKAIQAPVLHLLIVIFTYRNWPL